MILWFPCFFAKKLNPSDFITFSLNRKLFRVKKGKCEKYSGARTHPAEGRSKAQCVYIQWNDDKFQEHFPGFYGSNQ
jgi:hypothetical protein